MLHRPVYRVHESDETLGYERPETPSIARPVVEPVAMPPRALRAQKTVRPTIPEFVKAAKIELQGDKLLGASDDSSHQFCIAAK